MGHVKTNQKNGSNMFALQSCSQTGEWDSSITQTKKKAVLKLS
jgi:hypothetical protein